MNWFSLAAATVVASVLGLAGCGDKHDPKAQLDPQFPAALAEGIDFRNPDYPSFVVEVAGMSGHEPWGRWTDAAAGPTAKFRFKQALPKLLTLEITANAFGPNHGQPIKVRIGGAEKTFVITTQPDPATYHLVFETDGTADTLEITPPRPISPSELDPNSKDPRKLGIAFVALKIKD